MIPGMQQENHWKHVGIAVTHKPLPKTQVGVELAVCLFRWHSSKSEVLVSLLRQWQLRRPNLPNDRQSNDIRHLC